MLAVLAELTRTTPATPEAAATVGARKPKVPAVAQRTLVDACVTFIASNFSQQQISQVCLLHEELRILMYDTYVELSFQH